MPQLSFALHTNACTQHQHTFWPIILPSYCGHLPEHCWSIHRRGSWGGKKKFRYITIITIPFLYLFTIPCSSKLLPATGEGIVSFTHVHTLDVMYNALKLELPVHSQALLTCPWFPQTAHCLWPWCTKAVCEILLTEPERNIPLAKKEVQFQMCAKFSPNFGWKNFQLKTPLNPSQNEWEIHYYNPSRNNDSHLQWGKQELIFEVKQDVLMQYDDV